MNHENTSPSTADLLPRPQVFFKYLKKLFPIVLLLAVLFAGLSYYRSLRSYTPRYKSEAVFSVSINSSGSTDISSYSYYYDNAAAKFVADSFTYILQSDMMREALLDTLQTPALRGSISASSVAGTNFFVLTVTSSNPQDAYDIIRAVMEVYPKVCLRIVGDTQFVISRNPTLATEPYTVFSWKDRAVRAGGTGLLLGLLLVLVVAMLNRTILSVDDVKELTSMQCLSSVPDMGRKAGSRGSSRLLLSRLKTDSGYKEAFRMLHLKVLRSLREAHGNVVMFTSSVPSEGKSSISANTALSLASDGKKVVLVDGDLRSPSVKGLFECKGASVGLGDCIRDHTSNVQLINIPDTSLYLFAGDEAIADPTPLLRREKLGELIGALRKSFDYVVIDTPPCVMMADASAFAALADSVVYVIREDFVTGEQLVDGIQSLSSNGAKICGFVMNRVTRAGASAGKSYGGYGYKYGYSAYGDSYSGYSTDSKKK